MSQIFESFSSWKLDRAEAIVGWSFECWVVKEWRLHSRRPEKCELLSTKDPHALAALRPHAYTMNEDRYRLVKCGVSDERHSLNDKNRSPNSGATEQQDAKGQGTLARKARD